MQFTNRNILITGSNRGIGKALLQCLLKKDITKIYTAARHINDLPDFHDNRVIPVTLDITKQDQIDKVTTIAHDIDLLINNAGALTAGSIFSNNIQSIRNDMEVNYFGLLHMMRSFAPILQKQPNPAIANITSIAAFVNFPTIGGYCASKAAAFSITQAARIELAHQNIAVHSINPGPIDTDMASDMDMDKTSPHDTAKAILKGLENDQPNIFPDPIGRQMFESYCQDYRALEHMAQADFNAI